MNHRLLKHRLLTALILLVGMTPPAAADVLELPAAVALQGSLTTSSGQPWQGAAKIRVVLYDSEFEGSVLYEETFPEALVDSGRFALELGHAGLYGDGMSSLAELFNVTSEVWMGVAVGDAEELPRTRFLSQSFSYRAQMAAQAEALVCDACIGAALIGDGAITATKLAPGAVGAAALAMGSVSTDHLEDASVTGDQLASGAVGSAQLALASVTEAHLTPGSVGVDHLGFTCQDGEMLRFAKGIGWECSSSLSPGAVETIHLGSGIVGNGQIANGAVSSSKLAQDSVGSMHLLAESVTSIDIANGTITTADIKDGMVTTDDLANAAVTSGKLAGGAVTTSKIVDGAVTTAQLGTASVDGSKIKPESINGAHIAANSIGAGDIANNAVGTAELAAGAVGGVELKSHAVKGLHIADGSIGAADIADASISGKHLAGAELIVRKERPGCGGGLTTEGICVTEMCMVDPNYIRHWNCSRSSCSSLTPVLCPLGFFDQAGLLLSLDAGTGPIADSQ